MDINSVLGWVVDKEGFLEEEILCQGSDRGRKGGQGYMQSKSRKQEVQRPTDHREHGEDEGEQFLPCSCQQGSKLAGPEGPHRVGIVNHSSGCDFVLKVPAVVEGCKPRRVGRDLNPWDLSMGRWEGGGEVS